jgi:hypothetical protein
VLSIFKIDPCELFAHAGFKPLSWAARVMGVSTCPHFKYCFFFFFVILGFELRDSCLLGRHFYHLSHSVSPQDGILLCFPHWPWTCNLSASASEVAGIIGTAALHFFFFGGTEVWTHGFILAKQVPCHLQSIFCCGYFGDGSLLNCLPGLASNHDPPDLSLPSR